MTEPTDQPTARRVRRTSADKEAHAVLSYPDDPQIGQQLAAPGSEYVSTKDGVEYRLDPDTGVAVSRA